MASHTKPTSTLSLSLAFDYWEFALTDTHVKTRVGQPRPLKERGPVKRLVTRRVLVRAQPGRRQLAIRLHDLRSDIHSQ
jgi:hypothetical protein